MPEPKKTNEYTVIRDTREQEGQGWFFTASKNCLGTVVKKLDTGDYSIVGYEKAFTIERKGSVSEFAGNLTEKRFEKELERMRTIPYPVVLLEFEVSDLYRWPEGSGIPKKDWHKIKTSSHFLVKRLFELQFKFPYVHFLFAGSHGKDLAASIFKRALESASR